MQQMQAARETRAHRWGNLGHQNDLQILALLKMGIHVYKFLYLNKIEDKAIAHAIATMIGLLLVLRFTERAPIGRTLGRFAGTWVDRGEMYVNKALGNAQDPQIPEIRHRIN